MNIIIYRIINYISVIERTKEIGILRSVGARRIDILQIFTVEAFLIGLLSGIIGVCFSFILKKPINMFVQKILVDSLDYSYGAKNYDMVNFVPHILLIVIIGSAILTFVSSLIPSIIGCFKKPIDALK